MQKKLKFGNLADLVLRGFYLHTRYNRCYIEQIDDSGNICCLVKRMGES